MANYQLSCLQASFTLADHQFTLQQAQQQLTTLAEQGVQLAIFPPYWGLSLINQRAKLLRLPLQGDDLYQSFLVTGSELAKHAGLYLVPGSLLVLVEFPDTQTYQLQHKAFLFSPKGQLLLEQAQTHFSRWEAEWLLAPHLQAQLLSTEQKNLFKAGEQLEVAATPIGKIGLLLGTDVYYPEVSRILGLQGAELVVALTAQPLPYNSWKQVTGLWQQCQQNQFFGAETCLVGSFLGQNFAGQSSIYGPCEITPGENGSLAQAKSCTQPEQLIGRVDLQTLKEIRSRYPLRQHYNLALYRQELQELYHHGDLENGG